MKQTLIPSQYNYIIDRTENVFWFNGISREYFIIKKELSDKLKLIYSNNTDLLEKNSPKLFKQLLDGGFIVDSTTNELDIIRAKHKESVESKDYFMIILPTLNCNFKCWYCVQDHINTKMELQTVEKIKKHIWQMVENEHITFLHIEWFGGEPLMYFDDIIEPISGYAMELCEKANIPFINSATTNAYYLNSRIYNTIERLKFSTFQITIDGVRDVHNQVKFSNDLVSAFDHALSQINELLSATQTPRISLRINYTENSLNDQIVDQMNEIIQPGNRKRIRVYYRRVWQEQTNHNRTETIKALQQKFAKSGYEVLTLDIIPNFISCYADKKYFNTINYNGHIIKCSANKDLYSKTPLGTLQNDGTILWPDNFLQKYYIDRFENNICTKCRHLPVCMGTCAREYDTEGDFICKRTAEDSSVEELIINYIEQTEGIIN